MEAAILSRSFVPVNTYTHPDNISKQEVIDKKIFMTEEEEIEHLELKLRHIESQIETIEIQKETLQEEIDFETQKATTLNSTITEINDQFQNYKTIILPKLTNQYELSQKINNLNSNLTESIEDNNELTNLKTYLETNLEQVSGKWFESANKQVEEERKKNFELKKNCERLELFIGDSLALAELEKDQRKELSVMIEKLEASIKVQESPSSSRGMKSPPSPLPESPQSQIISQPDSSPSCGGVYTLQPDFTHPSYIHFLSFKHASSQKGIYQSSNFWKSILAEDIEPSSKFKQDTSSIWSSKKQIINYIIDDKVKLDYSNTNNSDKNTGNKVCSLCAQELLHPSEVYMTLPNNALPQIICSNCESKLTALMELTKFLRQLRDPERPEGGSDEEDFAELLRLKQSLFLARTGSNFNHNS
jgi:hypothetical protein